MGSVKKCQHVCDETQHTAAGMCACVVLELESIPHFATDCTTLGVLEIAL